MMNIQKILFNNLWIALIGLSITLVSCDGSEPTIRDIDPPEDPDIEEPVDNQTGTIRDITTAELVSEMGTGWNLGNSFDVTEEDKTAWGNPLPTKQMIDLVKEMGFGTVRIPVTWFTHQDEADFEVKPEYMQRVKNIVNYTLANRMFAIVNTHHEEDWIKLTDNNADVVRARLQSLWTQIAVEFKDYGDSLIFETLNEPRTKGSPNEWNGGTSAERLLLNTYHKTCVDAIRATGGNNAKRHLMVSTYAASTVEAAMNDLMVPNNDPNIIISLHSYFPWAFAGEGNNRWGTDEDRAQLLAELDRVKRFWIEDANRAVIMGEWGAVNANDLRIREQYYEFYAKACAERGLVSIVWDDGGNFGLMDRDNYGWVTRTLPEIIVSAQQ
ncbi:MAG: glycoside hydrolase family 5 protein [Cyclobacteriaceae bacterium]